MNVNPLGALAVEQSLQAENGTLGLGKFPMAGSPTAGGPSDVSTLSNVAGPDSTDTANIQATIKKAMKQIAQMGQGQDLPAQGNMPIGPTVGPFATGLGSPGVGSGD